MSKRRVSRGLPALTVIVGTFAVPVAQWLVFFIVARFGGSADAGIFALLFAVSTPLVTGTNWGLRNGYITLRRRSPFADFIALRVGGILVASGLIALFGAYARLDAGMVAAVIAMKAADSMTDIWYGRWQRRQRLMPFGILMIVNGAATIACATLFGLFGLPTAWIVAGSAIGSSVALIGALLLDLRDIIAWLRRGGFHWAGAVGRLSRILVGCWQICAGQVLAGLVVNVPIWAVAFFGSADDIGRFAAAAYLITVGSLLGASLNSVSIGRYHAAMTSGGAVSVQRSVRRGNILTTGAGLLVVVAVGAVGSQVFQVIYGSQFTFTALELILVALAAALNPGTYLMNAALLALNSYGTQMSIYAVALLGSVLIAGAAAGLQLSGFLVGSLCALGGSLLKYALSYVWMKRIVRAEVNRPLHDSATTTDARLDERPTRP